MKTKIVKMIDLINKNGDFDFEINSNTPKFTIVLNRKNNIIFGRNGTGKTHISNGIQRILEIIRTHNFNSINLHGKDYQDFEMFFEEKRKLTFSSEQIIFELVIGKTKIVYSKWNNEENKNIKSSDLFSIEIDGDRHVVEYFDLTDFYIPSQPIFVSPYLTKEHFEMYIKKNYTFFNEVATPEFLQHLISHEDVEGAVKNKIEKWEKEFGDKNNFDNDPRSFYMKYDEQARFSRFSNIYRSIQTWDDVEQKILYGTLSVKEKIINIIFEELYFIYRRDLIVSILVGCDEKKLLLILMSLNCICEYFSNYFVSGTSVIGNNRSSNTFSWPTSSMTNLGSTTPMDMYIIFNKQINDYYVKNFQIHVSSAKTRFENWKNQIYKTLESDFQSKCLQFKIDIIKWLGFDDKIKYENGIYMYINGEKKLSSGWNSIVNKIIDPFSSPDFWKSKIIIMNVDDPTDMLDQRNALSIATFISKIENIGNITGNIKKIIFSHDIVFTKRIQQLTNSRDITELCVDYSTKNYFSLKTEPKYFDFVEDAVKNIKNNIHSISDPKILINQCRVISEWLDSMYKPAKKCEIIGVDNFIFSETFLNPLSHFSEIKDFDDKKIRIGIEKFVNDITFIFDNKFSC